MDEQNESAAPEEAQAPEQETSAPVPQVEEVVETSTIPAAVEAVAQDPEPTAPEVEEKPEPPPPIETAPAFDPEMVARLGDLEAKIKDYEKREAERQAEDIKAAEASRESMLEEYGILDPLYSRIAPSISEADPRTPEGKEVLRQWMVKHPSLFKKSPTLEKITHGSTQEVKKGFGKKLSFGDAIRKLRG